MHAAPTPAVDPVQSIRVASTLVQRFRAILATNPGSIADLELMIGESQQLYPEIWRHLDDAYRVLRTRGALVEYEALRRAELVQLGVTNVDVTEQLDHVSLMLGTYAHTQVKSATFNVTGYDRAAAACRTLMAAMPEVDWGAIVRAEDREIAAVGSLRSRRWRGVLIALALVAAVVVVMVLVIRSSADAGDDPPARTRAGRDSEANAQVASAEQRDRRLGELREAYWTTCDRAHLPELIQLERDSLHLREARALETTACVPAHPSCDAPRDAIAARLVSQLALVRDTAWRFHCEGILLGRAGKLVPALAIVVTAHGTATTRPSTLRGVTSADGERDLVPFVPSPVPTVVGIADLDGDSTDELVMVGTTELVVTRILPDGFVDARGPTLAASCSADVHVTRDLRGGSDSERKAVLIDAADGPARKGCLPPGLHYYRLVGGALTESD